MKVQSDTASQLCRVDEPPVVNRDPASSGSPVKHGQVKPFCDDRDRYVGTVPLAATVTSTQSLQPSTAVDRLDSQEHVSKNQNAGIATAGKVLLSWATLGTIGTIIGLATGSTNPGLLALTSVVVATVGIARAARSQAALWRRTMAGIASIAVAPFAVVAQGVSVMGMLATLPAVPVMKLAEIASRGSWKAPWREYGSLWNRISRLSVDLVESVVDRIAAQTQASKLAEDSRIPSTMESIPMRTNTAPKTNTDATILRATPPAPQQSRDVAA